MTLNWQELERRFRSQMPVSRRLAYFDHAAVAPLSQPAAAAISTWLAEARDEGDVNWPRWARRVEQVRCAAAALIAAEPDEIALVPNTTSGLSIVAEGFPWRPGDNMLLFEGEFPSNQYPWMNLASRGVQPRRLPAEAVERFELIEQACDSRTRLIAISWVGYAGGARIDLASLLELAHRRGVLVCLDAIQGLGVFPLNVRRLPVDFLAADGHKWLLGPEGAGVLYIARRHLESLRPLGVGWNSVRHAHDFSRVELELRPSAQRYEGGSQNMAGVHGLGGSLELLIELGLGPDHSPIAERVLDYTEHLRARLAERGAVLHGPADRKRRSGIVSFELPGRDAAEVRAHCLEQGVVLSVRHGMLRASPHGYNNEDDLEQLLAALP